MTRSYALKRLLEHGALKRAEIVEITGWTKENVHSVLQYLAEIEAIKRENGKWKLA
jgi:DNA-binding IclR family transcriptional regulator